MLYKKDHGQVSLSALKNKKEQKLIFFLTNFPPSLSPALDLQKSQNATQLYNTVLLNYRRDSAQLVSELGDDETSGSSFRIKAEVLKPYLFEQSEQKRTVRLKRQKHCCISCFR